MSVIAVGSVRSCGATTLAVALAGCWPAERRVLLVEADPAGGTVAAGAGWPAEPGLLSLAAAARHGGQAQQVWEHTQLLPGGTAVLAAPAAGEQARTALRLLTGLLGRLDELDADVIVDCGRLDPTSPVLGVWEAADRAVLAVRPRLADLHAAASWLPTRAQPAGLAVVTVGGGAYPDVEIAGALGVQVAGRLAWDPAGAEALLSWPAGSRGRRLTALSRSARGLAEQIAPPATPAGAVTAALGKGVPGAPAPVDRGGSEAAPAEGAPEAAPAGRRIRLWPARPAAADAAREVVSR